MQKQTSTPNNKATLLAKLRKAQSGTQTVILGAHWRCARSRTSKRSRPSLELTGQTEGQIRGEEAQRAKQQSRPTRQDNAPPPDDFTDRQRPGG